MGTDIDIHLEYRIGPTAPWHHNGHIEFGRYYRLFGKMAGVRGQEDDAISPPKGMPEDADRQTKDAHKNEGGHSVSWLDWDELLILKQWCDQDDKERQRPPRLFDQLMGGQGWWRYLPKGVTDIRLVFWFDF
jgi:hypothetical protein